jgi:uncharacterized protein YwbE
MPQDLPRSEDLRQGMSVEIEQEDGDHLIGDVGVVLDDEFTPGGVTVRLQSGVTGQVKQIHPEE